MREVEIPVQHKQLELEAFNLTKARLEATKRVAILLSSSGSNPEGLDLYKKAESERIVTVHRVDARGYDEQTFTNVYHSSAELGKNE